MATISSIIAIIHKNPRSLMAISPAVNLHAST